MARLQYEQCLGCDSFVPFILDTTALYVAKCWWCGCKMTQIHGIRRTAKAASPTHGDTQPGPRREHAHHSR